LTSSLDRAKPPQKSANTAPIFKISIVQAFPQTYAIAASSSEGVHPQAKSAKQSGAGCHVRNPNKLFAAASIFSLDRHHPSLVLCKHWSIILLDARLKHGNRPILECFSRFGVSPGGSLISTTRSRCPEARRLSRQFARKSIPRVSPRMISGVLTPGRAIHADSRVVLLCPCQRRSKPACALNLNRAKTAP
jgi:hypothetical protein